MYLCSVFLTNGIGVTFIKQKAREKNKEKKEV